MINKSFLWLFTFFVTIVSVQAHAQTVIVDQPLYFGRWVIPDFNSRARVTIRNNGSYTTNTNIYLLDTPTRGEYTLTGAPPNTSYSITTPPIVYLSGPGGDFEFDNIRVRPNSLVTNGIGEDQFRITGRLRSLGGGVSHGDGNYNDSFTIIFNF